MTVRVLALFILFAASATLPSVVFLVTPVVHRYDVTVGILINAVPIISIRTCLGEYKRYKSKQVEKTRHDS